MATESRNGTVLVTCRQMQVELDKHRRRIEDAGYEISAPPVPGQQFDEAALIELLDGVVGVIAGDDPFSARVLEAATSLRVLIRWGIGMDSVDHDAAARLGISVTNTPGVFGGEVADSAMAYLLLLARRHHQVDAAVRAGRWPSAEGTSLAGQTVGVVGFGSIGRAIAQRARGFDMRVLAYDVADRPATLDGVELVDLGDLLHESRFVVLAAPLTAESHHLLDARTIALMRPDAFVINVGRGPLVDETALSDALAAGRLAGAGLDVYEVEPLPDASPLRQMDNVVLGAHNGSNTRQGVERTSAIAVDRLLELLARAS